jgi:hypothetical protein
MASIRVRRIAFGLLLAPALSGAAPHGVIAVICTNPAGHASWQIRIDFQHGTVDSNPARISKEKITWRDRTDRGNYTLDRTSGDLTVVLPSSTGGYFLHDHCALDPLKARP